MKHTNILDTITDLKAGINQYSEDFIVDLDITIDNRYISDAITEWADSNTSIYYSDILEYIKNNPDKINDSVNELGLPDPFDIYQLGQQAEFLDIDQQLYEDSEDIIKILAYQYLYDIDHNELIDNELNDYIDAINDEISTNDRFETIVDYVDAYFSNNDEI